MNVFEMVVIIVVIGCGTGVLTEYFKTKRKTAGSSVINDDLDDALDKIENLEERVRILEKVVTDDRYDLGREIDSLKDKP